MFLVCSIISQRRLRLCSSSRSFLALGWVSHPALPAQTVVRNPMRAWPTRLNLILSLSDCWARMRPWSSSLLLPEAEFSRWGSRALPFFSITRHFSRRTSSLIFPRSDGGVTLYCDDYRTVGHSPSLLETGERSPAPPLTRL